MPVALLKTLTGAWDQVRGYLHDDLERIEMELNLPVDLSDSTGTLPIDVLPNITAGTLLGRGSASGNGPAEEIDLGPGLVMNGTTLQVSPSGLGSSVNRGSGMGASESTPGRRGAVGPQGPPGLTGPRGMRGNDGERGPAGPAASGSSFSRTTLYWTLLTNGDTIEPELVFDGSGDVIWVAL